MRTFAIEGAVYSVVAVGARRRSSASASSWVIILVAAGIFSHGNDRTCRSRSSSSRPRCSPARTPRSRHLDADGVGHQRPHRPAQHHPGDPRPARADADASSDSVVVLGAGGVARRRWLCFAAGWQRRTRAARPGRPGHRAVLPHPRARPVPAPQAGRSSPARSAALVWGIGVFTLRRRQGGRRRHPGVRRAGHRSWWRRA